MSEPVQTNLPAEDLPEQENGGPNLVLLYLLLGLALLAAIGFAVWIILPFYLRR